MKLLSVDRGHFVVVLDVGLLIKAIVMASAFYGATPAATDHLMPAIDHPVICI